MASGRQGRRRTVCASRIGLPRGCDRVDAVSGRVARRRIVQAEGRAIAVPQVDQLVRGAWAQVLRVRGADARGPVVVVVVIVKEAGVIATSTRRVIVRGHATVPLANERSRIASSAKHCRHAGHVSRNSSKAGDGIAFWLV